MLSDIERKILRILVNFQLMQRRTPVIRELSIKTGRSEDGIKAVLQRLHEEQYIEWSQADPELIKVLEAWERPKR